MKRNNKKREMGSYFSSIEKEVDSSVKNNYQNVLESIRTFPPREYALLQVGNSPEGVGFYASDPLPPRNVFAFVLRDIPRYAYFIPRSPSRKNEYYGVNAHDLLDYGIRHFEKSQLHHINVESSHEFPEFVRNYYRNRVRKERFPNVKNNYQNVLESIRSLPTRVPLLHIDEYYGVNAHDLLDYGIRHFEKSQLHQCRTKS